MPRRASSCGRMRSSAVPSQLTVPASARTNPQITLNSVVLPAPLGPITPTTSPGPTVSETPSSAVRPPKRTVTPSTSSELIPGRFLEAACALIVGIRQSSPRPLVRRSQCRGREEELMSIGILEPLAQGEKVRAERARILGAVQERIDAVVDAALVKMCDEIPAYAAAGPAFFADVRDQVPLHYRLKLERLLSEEDVSPDDLAFARGAAMRRARSGFALEDYINAFRVGQQVFWEAVVESAGTSALGREAALTLAMPLMRYVDVASTHAGHAFAEFLQHAVADADRERRDLLEHLLAGEMPARGPLCAAAQSYGLTPDAH